MWTVRAVVVVIVVTSVIGAVIIELVRLWVVPDIAGGDRALIEIETRRTLSMRPPMLGAYSRYGWRHPGPVLFYLLAVPYWMLGSGVKALNTGALVVNAVAMASMLWLMWRRGTAAFAVIGAIGLLLVSALGREGISDAWNVSVTLVPSMLLVLGCWSLLCGDPWAAPIVVITYLFVLETHVGTGVVVTPVVIGTTIVVLADPSRRRQLTGRAWIVAGTGACALVLASPIAVDVVRDPPGNLGRLVRWSATNTEQTTGWGDSVRLLARTSSVSFPFDPRPPRFLLTVSTDELGVLPGVLVVSLIAALVMAILARKAEEAWLCAVMLLFWVSALLAVRSIVAPPPWWLVEWLQPLGWLTIAAVVLTAWRILASRIGRSPVASAGSVIGLGCIAAISVANVAIQGSEASARRTDVIMPVNELADAIEALAADDRVRLQLEGSDFRAEVMLAGVVNELESRNVPACVQEQLAYKFPDPMICADAPVRVVLRSEPAVESAPPDSSLLAVSDPLSADERTRADATRAAIVMALIEDEAPELLSMVDTPFVADVLLEAPTPRVAALAAEVRWLDEIRERPGLRYALYLVGGHQI